MPLQIRRGTEVERLAMTQPLAAGELLFVTNTQRIFAGDGFAIGGIAVTGYTNAESRDEAAAIFASGTHTGITFAYNTATDAMSATVDLSNYQGVIRANAFKGSVFADDGSTIGGTELVNAVDGSINLNGTVQGHIVPNANISYDLGSASYRFRDLYLSGSSINLGNATITATGSAVNLPLGSTLGGVAINIDGVTPGSNYNINVVGDDSTLILNSSTKVVTATLVGNLGANLDLAGNSITGNGNVNIAGLVSFTNADVAFGYNPAVLGESLFVNALTDGTINNLNVIGLGFSKGFVNAPVNTNAGDFLGGLAIKGYRTGVADPYRGCVAFVGNWHSSADFSGSAPAGELNILVGSNGSQKIYLFGHDGKFTCEKITATQFIQVPQVSGTLPTPAAGMIVLDGGTFKGYTGSAWVDFN